MANKDFGAGYVPPKKPSNKIEKGFVPPSKPAPKPPTEPKDKK